jgi:hypothetical protein
MGTQFTLPLVLMGIIVALLAFHALVCLFVYLNPQAAAAEIAKPDRSFLAWIYLTSLQLGRGDAEMDLVQAGLPAQTLTDNCRRRAVMGMGSAALGAGLIAFMTTRF